MKNQDTKNINSKNAIQNHNGTLPSPFSNFQVLWFYVSILKHHNIPWCLPKLSWASEIKVIDPQGSKEGRRGGVRCPDHTYIHQQYEALQEIEKAHSSLGITTSRMATQEHSKGIIDLSPNPSSDWGDPVAPRAHLTPELPAYPKRGHFVASHVLLNKKKS